MAIPYTIKKVKDSEGVPTNRLFHEGKWLGNVTDRWIEKALKADHLDILVVS